MCINCFSRPGYWQINLDKIYCFNFGFTDDCTLNVAYCQELPPTISGCNTSESELGLTSLCVTNGTVGYSLGAYDDSKNPFEMSKLLYYIRFTPTHTHTHTHTTTHSLQTNFCLEANSVKS